MEHVLCQFGSQYLRRSCRPFKKVLISRIIVPVNLESLLTSRRAVRAHEANFEPMRNYLSIIACMSNISNTESIHLSAELIQECDEDIVKPTGKGFIKQYHHFTYVSAGVIKCQYIRGQGDYKQHTLKQQVGTN